MKDGRTTGARRLAILLATAAMLLVPSAALAQDQTEADTVAALGLEAQAGYDGLVVVGAWSPVAVRLAPEAPFAGRILLAAGRDGSTILQSLPVEVGAGVEKVFVVLAPPRTDLQVQVVADGADSGPAVRPTARRVDGFLVGVLGAIPPDEVPGLTLPQTDQRAHVVAVDDTVLRLGVRALAPLSTLVVRHADLLALTPDARAGIAGAVAGGATLVVTGTSDTELGLPWRAHAGADASGLIPAPRAWVASSSDLDAPIDPGAAGEGIRDLAAVAAGRGRVVVTTLDPGSEARPTTAVWEHLLQPSVAGTTDEQTSAWSNLPGEVEQVFATVSGRPVAVGWLAGFFVLYVVVAGPVLGLTLSRRRRPELAWVALPVVTAVFAAAAFVGASGTRPRVGVSGQVSAWVDGVGTALTVAGVRSPTAADRMVTLPGTGWDLSQASWSGSARVTVGDDTDVELSLPAQTFGAVVGWRPLEGTPPLDVEVAVFDDEARIEVTNTSPIDLEDVRVAFATRQEAIAEHLAAGETVVATVPLPDSLPRQRDPFGMPFDGPFDMDRGPEVLASLVRWDSDLAAPGIVRVSATSPEGATALGMGVATVDGNLPTDRGTYVLVAVTPTTTDDVTSPFEVQRDLLASGRGDTWRDAPLTVSGMGLAPLRFRLPAEGDVTALTLALANEWNGGGAFPEPMPVERCGPLETRDGETNDLISVTDHCGQALPCPPDASSCSASDDGRVVTGENCFPDGRCEVLTWDVIEGIVAAPPNGAGMQLWDRLERTWVDAATVGETVAPADLARWVSPLGEVWARATGEFFPLDVATQAVGATLGEA